jgi:hypothetical protein
MKFFSTLTLAFFWAATSLFAQAVLINSPVEIAGGYDFSAAEFGANLADGVWTADVVFVDDGSALPNQGCNAAINTAELAGKIALVDRGSCEFGLKCLNAQQGGALAVVVFNNAPGNATIVMGAGSVGGQVTIPSLMLSYEVGQLIRAALVTGPVNMTIGDVVPPPPPANDLALSNTSIIVAPLGIVPASQIKAAGDFIFTPGANARNRGTNAAPNLVVNAVVNHTPFGGTPTEVYNETVSADDELLPDSTSAVLLLPEFDPFGLGDGVFSYVYSISSDSTDEVSFNNQATSSFTISDKLYSKASWDPTTGAPRVIATTTIAGGGDIEFLTILKIPHGFGYKIDSVMFEVRHTPTLADIPVEAYVYEWNDLNEDGLMGNDEIAIVGLATLTFPSNYTQDRTLVRLPFLDFQTFEEDGVVIPEDNKNYIIGVRYTGSQTVSFGFDSSNDYTQYLEWKAANEALNHWDYGFLGINSWDNLVPNVESAFSFTGNLGFASSTGVILTSLTSNVSEPILGPDAFEVKLFPNPATEYLQVNLDFKQPTSFVEYVITDMAGRTLQTLRDTEVFETEQARFKVGHLPAGRYNLTIRTEQGIRTGGFIVKR